MEPEHDPDGYIEKRLAEDTVTAIMFLCLIPVLLLLLWGLVKC